MTAVESKPDYNWTLPQLRRHFWMIPAERILLTPFPGSANEDDVVWMNDRGYRLCELVDGVLIAKTVGFRDSYITGTLICLIGNFVEREKRGIVLGPDGFFRLQPGLVYGPDVSFVSWERLPGGKIPDEEIPSITPDLAVEVISESNTKREMAHKLGEYFDKDVRLAWLVYPKTSTVEVCTSPTRKHRLRLDQTLDGGDVLPGFSLRLKQLFALPKRGR